MGRPRLLPSLLACLAGLSAANARGEPGEAIGRLFHTPEERRQLDQLRNLGAARPGIAAERPGLRLDGVVRHPDGRHTTWVNGQLAPPGRVAPGATPGEARVAVERGKSVSLRVGESLPAGASAPDSLLGAGRAGPDRGRPPTAP
jgi:hypothetical protein